MMSQKCSWSGAYRGRLPGLRATGHTVSLSLDSGSLDRRSSVGRGMSRLHPSLPNLKETLLIGAGSPLCVKISGILP